ncbi:SWF or SNF family helicase [Streptomyces sp. LX-29]|uniref:SWIM zinc finger family protein n=1 Tax=Streptomyces sp. LX-29 TaxID=2900152 RepID=UPI00240E28EA|nr:SWF or SNF family helicase [Streptomyces sp. LX-29]WFB11119.1 SWF or SNF family helicase [Streptomyces sp. LX-29]
MTEAYRTRRGESPAERTFAALPPARGRGFATTWWGRAWLKALEDTALDGDQLRRGRVQARAGAVGAVSVRPGRITSVVRDRDGTQQRSDVLLREFDEAEWDRLLAVVADRAGNIAALLDREMPPHLAEDAAAAGVELLPGIGDLEPECGCAEWDHCPHTAALCYQVARLLDQDPFVLLLVRGRTEREVLDELQERSAARAAAAVRESAPDEPAADPADGVTPTDRQAAGGTAAEGISAAEAFAGRALVAPLPDPPPTVAEPGVPPALGGGTDPAPGLDPGALEFLAADAAVRARRLLAEALAPEHATAPFPAGLSVWQDAVRLAADAGAPNPDTARIRARLAEGCGRDRGALERAVRAWQHGGVAGLAVLEEDWAPDAEALARARAELAAAWEDQEDGEDEGDPAGQGGRSGADAPGGLPRLRASGNRWTAVGANVQLRYGRDGRWWPYRKERGQWWPAGPCAEDPAAALAGLLTD